MKLYWAGALSKLRSLYGSEQLTKTNIDAITESDRKEILEYIEPLRDRAYEGNEKNGYYSLGIGPQYGNDDDYMSGVIALLKEGRNKRKEKKGRRENDG